MAKFANRSLFENKNIAIIDSSKEIKHYRLNFSKYDDVVTLLVLRKFRPWYASVLASRVRNNRNTIMSILTDKKFIMSNLRLYLRRFLVFAFAEWFVTHVRFLFAIRERSYVVTCSADIERIANELANLNLLPVFTLLEGIE